jgi:hypothetical protein
MGILGLTPQLLRDSAATDEARRRFAVAKVYEYLERVVSGQAGFVPIPAFLAESVREGQSWAINGAGLRRAVDRATELRARADSLAGPQPRLGPAVGPPPVPGPGDTSRP